ncbi:MAG: hypothetical protein J5802_02415 [Butyrivibrio sp.]|nr:hypothetical protein [Butyrivibrio sp.]
MKKRSLTTIFFAAVMMLTLVGCSTNPMGQGFAFNNDDDFDDDYDLDTDDDDFDDDFDDDDIDIDDIEDDDDEYIADVSSGGNALSEYDLYFEYEGEIVSIHDDIETIIDTLGAADKESMLNGQKVYTWGTFPLMLSVVTVEDEITGEEKVYQIATTDATVRTLEDIGCGDTEEDVIKAYGEPHARNRIDDESHDIAYFDGDYGIIFGFYDGSETISMVAYVNYFTNMDDVRIGDF